MSTGRTKRGLAWIVLAGGMLIALTHTASAQPAHIAFDAGDDGAASARHFVISPPPAAYGSPQLHARWRDGRDLELDERFVDAAKLHQALALRIPDEPYAYWMTSRNLWRHAESLPTDAKDERMAFFRQSDLWAARGMGVDAECAPCMLWKFGAMGRIATTSGVMQSLRMGREMKSLLDRGIALSPSFADTPTNSTLGNLYYASAVFHRVIPEWTWLKWLVGVKGDLDESLAMIRAAVDLSPQRIDYLVEYGAVLNCYADRRDEDWAGAEEFRRG